ncbi:MAG: gamma-glutamyl-gamma-aminobutyrate hydrolase family protein [Actinomycetota bacterium]
MTPLIGIVGRRRAGGTIGMPTLHEHAAIDLYFADYARGVSEAGGLAMFVPVDADPAAVVERVDGLILTGGADLDPVTYGRAAISEKLRFEPERDQLELDLLGLAAETDTAVLGICRGLQLANVHGGGTLHQHVPEHAHFDKDRTELIHDVTFEPGSLLAGLYGDRLAVNSLHHQTADTIGEGYRVTGRAPDGTVEGLEHESSPVVAVQWHPEMLPGRPIDPIFRWLVETAVPSRA